MKGYKKVLNYAILFLSLLILNLLISGYLRNEIQAINSQKRSISRFLTSLGEVESILIRGADNGLRGYALTKAVHLLGPYYLALQEKGRIFNGLRSAAIELQIPASEIEHLDSLVQDYFDFMTRSKVAIENDKLETVQKVISDDQGYPIWKDYSKIREDMEFMLTEQDEENTSRLATLNDVSFASNLIVLLITVPLLFFMISSIKKYEINQSLQLTSIQRSQDSLKNALAEKDVLFKELHHRIKNNLQLITSLLFLKADRQDDELIKQFTKETFMRIQTVSKIHDQLLKLEEFSMLGIRDYVMDLVDSLIKNFSDHPENYEVTFNIEDHVLPIDKSLTIGLLINEVVSNILKYAYDERGPIEISFIRVHDQYQLLIGDEGRGIPEDDISNVNVNLGMQLIYLYADQLEADLKIVNNHGAKFILSFK